ncbi:MAG: hypothetical protein E6J90_10315 [Deltaproteobacteria bacterium]|nr:MAG: hypothetical protein E6J91_32310 [Deltaproteobacteria bacterium]TMQ23586.1 MAG: hypothetical protein E6J90_10315 [Deltaproteobacteria bacterium]
MARWIEAGGPYQFPFMGAASRTLRGERDIDCPKCGAARLRAYFHVFNPTKRTGTIWVWCRACRTTSHLPRVTLAADLGPDPFAQLTLEQFAALESDPAEPLLDRLDRLVDDGTIGGKHRA